MNSTGSVGKLKVIFTKPLIKHTASLIFLHGSGDTAEGIHGWLKMICNEELTFPHLKIIYPSAPLRPYTANAGFPSTVWFDRQQISPFCDEDLASINQSCHMVDDLVKDELKSGIPINRIIVGGFSMGGALALHYGFRFQSGLAGVFALSSFLNENSTVYQKIKEQTSLRYPALFQAHGHSDPLVNFDWGLTTYNRLKSLHIQCEFSAYENLFHEMNATEIHSLKLWMAKQLS